MLFVINGMKWDTDKMEKIAEVKKWYETDSFIVKQMFNGSRVGCTHDCVLWRTKNGRWLLTREIDYGSHRAEVIDEKEAKELLMQYALDKYEELFADLPEA